MSVLLLGLMIFVGIYRTVWWEIAAVAACVAAISTAMNYVTGGDFGWALLQFVGSFLMAMAIGCAARLVAWLIAGSRNVPGRTSRVEGFFGERRKR